MQKPKQPYTLSNKSDADRGVTFKQKTTARPQFRANEKRMVSGTLHKPRVRLNTLEATAICGNDITSSCVYVSAITASYAGAYTPIVLLLRKENIHLLMKDYNLFKRLTPIDFVFSINLGIFEGTFIFKHVSLGDATTLYIDPEKLETYASKQLKVHFTRMHSIGMRTACLLTVSRSICLWSGGVPQIPSPG